MKVATVMNFCLVIVLAAAFPSWAAAATHEVQVSGLSFSPNDLTIQVGDTVHWSSSGGNHDVKADDGSFSSGNPTSSINFSRTFNSVGEILYYCSVHSSPGQNINTNMNGRITVQSDGGDFVINPGLNDTWKNPGAPYQGFFITVFPDIILPIRPQPVMFLAWFTYDVERPAANVTAMLGEPGHRWLTAIGPYSGDTATLDIELTQGGIFDSGTPLPTQTPGYGTITVKFTSCSEGTVTYDIPSVGVSDSVPITRVANDNVVLCEAFAAP